MKKLCLHILVFLAVLLLTFSCEEETSWKLGISDPVVVVDAIITNENQAQHIQIYFSSTNMNEASIPISGVSITLTDGTNTVSFTESDTMPGHYYSLPFVTATTIDYALIIEYNDVRDTAFAKMVPVSPLRDYEFTSKDSLIKYIDSGSDLPSMTEVYYNWSNNPDYCASYGYCQAAETFYTLDLVDLGKEFAPDKQEILFPLGTTIYRKKYSLSEAHQKFVRSLLIETEWRGGLFDVEHGNIPTNFRKGTRGWFAVCQVVKDSVVVGQ